MKILRLLLLSAVFSFLFIGCYIDRDFRIEDDEIIHGSMNTIEGDFNIGKGAEVSGAY